MEGSQAGIFGTGLQGYLGRKIFFKALTSWNSRNCSLMTSNPRSTQNPMTDRQLFRTFPEISRSVTYLPGAVGV
jgi:hypothetical protein